jgi:YD repeat-containing protein
VTARGSDVFAYDQANRLTSATVGGTASTYSYDADGKRASSTFGTTTTSFVYDISGKLPMLLTDGTRKYVYGRGLAYETDLLGNIQAVVRRRWPGLRAGAQRRDQRAGPDISDRSVWSVHRDTGLEHTAVQLHW